MESGFMPNYKQKSLKRIFGRSDDVTKQEKWSQFVCPFVHTHYHIKAERLISHSASVFVRPIVARRKIFNGPLQDYIINKPLASLCFIPLAHTHTHTHGTCFGDGCFDSFC